MRSNVRVADYPLGIDQHTERYSIIRQLDSHRPFPSGASFVCKADRLSLFIMGIRCAV
jgi:hypothetical protein